MSQGFSPLESVGIPSNCVSTLMTTSWPGTGSLPIPIRDACIEQDVAFHFKQWGGVNKKATGRILDNRTWDQLPAQRRLTRASELCGGRD